MDANISNGRAHIDLLAANQASKQHVLANGLAVSAHHQSVQLIVSVNRGCVLFRAQLIQIGLDGRHKQVQSL